MPTVKGRVVAVVLCAGQGARMGAGENKVFLALHGEPLLAYSTRALVAAPSVDELLFVAHPDEIERVRSEIAQVYALEKMRGVVAGGATRHHSEERALAELRPDIEAGLVDILLIHDAARPFVRPMDVDALVTAARQFGAALLAAPVRDDEVIAQVGPDGGLSGALGPQNLFRAQTPQAFNARLLLAAYDRARVDGFSGTDTASSVERMGAAIHVVQGPLSNFKVTTPKDLLRADARLRRTEGARGEEH